MFNLAVNTQHIFKARDAPSLISKYDMKEISLFILISIHLVLLLFHLAVILKLVPYRLIWGGRLKSDKQMYQFESASVIFTVLFTIILFAKANCFWLPQHP